MFTKSLKFETVLLLLGIVLLASINIFNLSRLFYILYVVIAGLYFFPGALLFAKEKIKTDKLVSMFVICNTLFISYLMSLLKGNEVMQMAGTAYLLINLFFVFYFNYKSDRRFVLHLIAHFILVWCVLWIK